MQGGDAGCGGRLRDVLFLDMALEGAGRAALEASLGDLRTLATAAVQQQQVSTVEVRAPGSAPGGCVPCMIFLRLSLSRG